MWALAALGLVSSPRAASRRSPIASTCARPGAETGAPLTPTPEATATPRATATPEPTPKPQPVTRAERRIIRGWSDALRHGQVDGRGALLQRPGAGRQPAARVPGDASRTSRSSTATLPCGAKLVKMRRSAEPKFVVGIFRLTERPGAGECGTGTGDLAAVAFRIYRGHITSWIRADEELADADPDADGGGRRRRRPPEDSTSA